MNSKKTTDTTSKDQIYRSLRKAIITGRRKPGERLSIDDLKTAYGTSVTPVRDALQMLSQEGLIRIRPRAGYFVSRVTLKELRDMLDLREILEFAAVERAAERITEKEIAALEAVHSGYTGDDDDSYARYTEENRCFHSRVAEASGNRELAHMVGHLHDRLARFMVIRHAGDRLAQIHGRLIEELRRHDVSGAKEALREELKASREAILEKILQEEGAHWHLGSGDGAASS